MGDIIRAFKSTTAIAVNTLLSRTGKPLWQRNYYEHIIRDAAELDKIREYVATNPLRWASDRYNPERSVLVRDESGRLAAWEGKE